MSVAEEGFPVAVNGTVVGGGGAEVGPGFALVAGYGDGDAEEGVGTVIGVFGVVAEGAEDFAGGEL